MEKNPLWVWRTIDEVSRHALGWVLGDRSDASLQQIIRKVDTGTCNLMTDQWRGFSHILPENRHFWGKDLTFPIEGTNSDIRYRLAQFKRKTKASSRSLGMVNRSLLLFHCQLSLKIDPLLSLKIDPSTLFKKQTYRA